MLKKKRLFWVGVVVFGIFVGFRYGFSISLAGVVLLLVLLGALYAFRLATSRRGLGRLAEYHKQYGHEKLLEAAKARVAGRGSFAFVVLGDTRNRKKIAEDVYRRAAAEGPALVFNTGDMIRHGTAHEYLKTHVPLLAITDPAPMFCVPGNHERGARRDFAAFKVLYGDDRFSFDCGPCRFVGFNNSKRGRVDDADLRFLEQELSKPSAAHKFVFFHIPPRYFEERIVNDDRRRGFKENAQELRALLSRHQVDEVFMGHIHGYASEVIDGVRYTLTAGAGAPLSKRLSPEGRAYNYVVVHVGPDGLRREVVRLVKGKWVRDAD